MADEIILLNRIRGDVGEVSGSIDKLLSYAQFEGFNDNYEPQAKPRLVGTWTIDGWYTQAQLSQAQSAFDGLTIVADPAYLIDFNQLAVQTLDSTKPNYNPAASVRLNAAGYGVLLDAPPVEGQEGRWFITKAQAAAITTLNTAMNGADVVDSNKIVSSAGGSYNIVNFDEFVQFTGLSGIPGYMYYQTQNMSHTTLPDIVCLGLTNFFAASRYDYWPAILVTIPKNYNNLGVLCGYNPGNGVSNNRWNFHLCGTFVKSMIGGAIHQAANNIRVFVGDGLSAYHDQNMLELYRADAKWSQYSLNTWYSFAAPQVSYDGTDVTMTVGRTADIYYTTDGSTPTETSTKYTTPFAWDGVGVIKAISVGEGNTTYEVVAADDFYTQTTADPVIAISGSTIEITAEQGATVYYTTDGSHPNLQSTVYTEPLSYVDNITNKIRCFAQLQGSKNASAVVEMNVADTVALQTVNPQGEKYNPAVSVKMEQAGYGNYVDDNDKTKGWYLTKADAALITSLPAFKNITSVTDTNGICGTVGSSYDFISFNEFDYFSGITSLVDDNFLGCTNLTEITIGSSISGTVQSIFRNCRSLSKVTLKSDGIKNAGFGGARPVFSQIGSPSLQIVIGDGVTGINFRANGCTNLTSVVFPQSGFTTLASNAFDGCTSLASITLPETLLSIGTNAFANCTTLTSFLVPNSVTTLGNTIWSNCTSLMEVTIGTGISPNSRPESLFKDCASLEKIYLNSAIRNPGYGTTRYPFALIGSPSLQIIVGDSVNSAYMAFTSCTNLTSVVFPQSGFTTLASGCFSGCTSLQSITLPQTLTTIEPYAFKGCTSLLSVNIPNSVVNLKDFAFEGCTSLTEATIGTGVNYKSQSLFKGCTSLSRIYLNTTKLGSAGFGGAQPVYSQIGSSALEIVIGDGITGTELLINNCDVLTSVVFPQSGFTTIAANSFKGDTSLPSITIPSTVTSIKTNAFTNCTTLATITVLAITPPTLEADSFTNVPADTVIYVPAASVSAYQSAANWSARAAYIQAIPTT